MAYQSIDEILEINIRLEEQFVAFLKAVRHKFDDEESLQMVHTLLNHYRRDLLKLEDAKNDKSEKKEFVKSVPHVQIEETLPDVSQAISWDTKKLFRKVLAFQERNLKFYKELFENVSFKRSKDICEMLIKFKTEQIKWIVALGTDDDLQHAGFNRSSSLNNNAI